MNRDLETQQPTTPPPIPTLEHWAWAIGLFIINFGILDLHLQDFLQSILPEEEFSELRNGLFKKRVNRLTEHVKTVDHPIEKQQAVAQFLVRLEHLRDLRNHIAHGPLRTTLPEAEKHLATTLSLPKHFDGSDPPVTRHLPHEQLTSATKKLTELIETFQTLLCNYVVDAVIEIPPQPTKAPQA